MSCLIIQEVATVSPERITEQLRSEPGLMLLRTALFASAHDRYSFVAVRPILTFRCFGSCCEIQSAAGKVTQFGDPWRLLAQWMSRYELQDQIDLPFPLGGCFGYWGYDLKNFLEPKLKRRARRELQLPDCQVGFYSSLLAIDHHLGKSWIVSTGLSPDGSRSEAQARRDLAWWQNQLGNHTNHHDKEYGPANDSSSVPPRAAPVFSDCSRTDFIRRVKLAQRYIRSGDIYQVNLSQRLAARQRVPSWQLFQRLTSSSPAPFAAYLDCGDFQIVSSSPELFLRASGAQIQTRPIKGTRPRAECPTRDAQLAYELQTSPKETAELVMITDLLRNDLGKVCEFGSVQTPDLIRLERYPQVQHLVSTVTGQLRPDVDHLTALASCFPGGSITGAPKFRAMEIIDELEPTARGLYTGALGYIGFNREAQLSMIIRTAICKSGTIYFPVGAGIVADSDPEAEYEETLAKAGGFFAALGLAGNSPQLSVLATEAPAVHARP